MLYFFAITSFCYLVLWGILVKPLSLVTIAKFDPSKGTLNRNGRVQFSKHSYEGKVLLAFVLSVLLAIGAALTLCLCILIGFIWGF